MLHKETISQELTRVAQILVAAPELSVFRIVGGTTVALHIRKNKSPMPDMLIDISWQEIEESMIHAAKQDIDWARYSR